MRALAVGLVGLAGCTPLPPFQTLETARPLAPGQVLVSGGAMGAAGQAPGPDTGSIACCGGGVGRVRAGLPGEQELGIDGYVVSEGVWAGKLAYKRGLGEHFAFATGAGGTVDGRARDTTVGADAGVIASTDETELFGAVKHGRLYTALRLAGAMPVRGGIYYGGGITGALTVPFGVAVEHGPWQFAGELGAVLIVDRNNSFMNGAVGTYHGGGAYGVVAAGYVFGR
jgi:hypothetical protein